MQQGIAHLYPVIRLDISRSLPISSVGTVTFKKPWKGCPDSRGSHSGSLIGNSLVVFGGYGGPGFSRRDFNDVHVSGSGANGSTLG